MLITHPLSLSPMSLTTSASPSYLCVLAHSLEVKNLFQLIIIQWIINLCIGRYRHVYMCIWQWEQFLMGPYDFLRLHTHWHGVLLVWLSSDPFIWPNFPWFSCGNDWYAICQSDSWVNELQITKGYRFQPLGNWLNNIRCRWPFWHSEGSWDALLYVGRLDWWGIFIWSIGGMHRLVVGWWGGRGMRVVGLCRSPGLVFAFNGLWQHRPVIIITRIWPRCHYLIECCFSSLVHPFFHLLITQFREFCCVILPCLLQENDFISSWDVWWITKFLEGPPADDNAIIFSSKFI